MYFLDDAHCIPSKNSGVMTYNSQAWKNSKDSGAYFCDSNVIQFEYNDGRIARFSFAIGAEGDNVMDTDLLFIGGEAYVLE